MFCFFSFRVILTLSLFLFRDSLFLLRIDHLKKCYKTSVVACWTMWIPLQTVTFSVVPVHLRAVFVCGCNLGWNVALDFIAHNT